MMIKKSFSRRPPVRLTMISCLVVVLAVFIFSQQRAPLVLQEMSWPEVRDYLKTDDMVIIPVGATEQHGPHLPLGTDFYEALEMSKLISARSGVVVAPVLMSGYSPYHTGFAGSLTLKSETMEAVLFETAEVLMKYGFRRFMFFSYHAGNDLVVQNVMHKINHTTEAVAVRIGYSASFQKLEKQSAPLDMHAGIDETSIMLYLKPGLVNMAQAKKPVITLPPKMVELSTLKQQTPSLLEIMKAIFAAPAETKKQSAFDEISSNGILTLGDPTTASKERGQEIVNQLVENAVEFIQAWKKVTK